MENLEEILGWASPIGLGFFLACLGLLKYLSFKSDKKEKEK